MSAQDHDQGAARPRLRTNRNDPLHDLQLLRDLETINTRMAREHGLLPPGGLPVQPKRKPQVPRPAVRSEAPPAEQFTTDDGR